MGMFIIGKRKGESIIEFWRDEIMAWEIAIIIVVLIKIATLL